MRWALNQWGAADKFDHKTDSTVTNSGAAGTGARTTLAYIPVAILMCAIISYIDPITVEL